MKTSPSSFFILGMLQFGATSGYAIKKATDVSMRYFWPTSLAQIYPELHRLEEQGLVVRHDDSHGARTRASYEVTEKGRETLLSWLAETDEEQFRFRDEGVLRLYFADALAPDDQIQLVRRLRNRCAETKSELRENVIPLGDALAEMTGTRFPGTIAHFGADVFAFAEEWLANLEQELEEGEQSEPNAEAAPDPEAS